ncbi:hypothetical protein AAGQ96_20130 [Pantoea sp. MBD-2R]|uniref:hypothetical protein n=1 Tax=Pantoea sp. MBD-2R TaxID=3141540 RepID=UPI00318416E5
MECKKAADPAGEALKKPPLMPVVYPDSGGDITMCQLIYRRKFLFNGMKNKALLLKKAVIPANPLF